MNNNTMDPGSEAGEATETIPEIPVPPALVASTTPATTAPLPWSRWLRSFLASNPFYLMSAALLLFGIYRISVGPGLFKTEMAQLAFNFGSLQFYEILLVGTAILLARRAVWYDSTLLTCVENAFVFVPFILVSQAALIGQKWVWTFCAVGVALALMRVVTAKAWLENFNLPARALGCGAIVLAVNAALPVVFRHLHESKIGTKPTEGAAYAFNEWSWLALLPMLIACANIFPKPRVVGQTSCVPGGANNSDDSPDRRDACPTTACPQRRWLPMSFFTLWLVATTTHLYSLGYVYDFDMRREWAAPAVLALAWTLWLRITDFVEFPGWKLNRALLIAPAFAPFVAGLADNKVTLALAVLNTFVFGALAVFGTQTRIARHLAFASLLTVIAAIPHSWGAVIVPGFNPTKAVAVAALVGLILPALLSRNPKLGFIAACALAVGVGALARTESHPFNWAMQAGCVFLLLHSLRWCDAQEKGLAVARGFTATLWVLHSFLWAHNGEPGAGPALLGLLVLAVWMALRQLRWIQARKLVAVAALLVLVSSPLDAAGRWMVSAPAGLLAVAGSFALFALGTAAALTKHRWHKAETRNVESTVVP